MLIQVQRKVKISCSQVTRLWGMLQFFHFVFCYEILNQHRPVCWSIVVNEKPTIGSPYFEAFPSDRILKATKDVNEQFFIYSFTFKDKLINILANSCKLH